MGINRTAVERDAPQAKRYGDKLHKIVIIMLK